MVLPLPTVFPEEVDVRTAQTTADTARRTVDVASAAVKEATDIADNAEQSAFYYAFRLIGGINHYKYDSDSEEFKRAEQDYNDANTALTLANNKLSTAKMAETKANNDLAEAVNNHTTLWNALCFINAIGKAHGTTRDVVKDKHDETQAVFGQEAQGIKSTVAREALGVKNSVAEAHTVTQAFVTREANNGRTHTNQAIYDHSTAVREDLGKQLKDVKESVKGAGAGGIKATAPASTPNPDPVPTPM